MGYTILEVSLWFKVKTGNPAKDKENMGLDVDGFHQEIQGSQVTIAITEQHPLIKLAKALPWDSLLIFILPDLQRTEKLLWWVGRPLRLRIHLGIYLLQQLSFSY